MVTSPNNMPPDWSLIRRRERQSLIAFAAVIPGMLLFGWPISALVGSEWPFAVAFFVFAGVFTVVALRQWLTPCPKCRGMFFQHGLRASPFARTCGSCGARKDGQ
jgi:hypothetical protein